MAAKIQAPPKSMLIKLQKAGKNYTDIARRYDVSRTTVKNWFKEYDLYSLPGRRKVDTPTRDELDRLISGGMSNDGLAGKFQCHVTTISLWLRTYNLLSKRARAHFRKMAENIGNEKVKPDVKIPANEFRNVPQFGALIEHANQLSGCYGCN